jgi:16S rRNA processing protein RimM
MMEEEFIFIGEITKPHGVKGEVRVLSLANNPQRFGLLKQVWVIHPEGPPTACIIQRVHYHKNFVLLKLTGCDTIDQAQRLVGTKLGIPKSQLCPLAKDNYYQFEIIGLKVYTADQQYLGTVKQILSTGSNDVYVVRSKSQEFLIPAIKQAIKQINLKQGHMILENMEGLIEPYAL